MANECLDGWKIFIPFLYRFPALSEQDDYYFRVRLYDENHNFIAYKIIKADDFASTVNSTGKYQLVLDTNTTFTMVDGNGNPINGTVHYDPTVYVSDEDNSKVSSRGIEIRLFKVAPITDGSGNVSHQEISSLDDLKNKGTDLIDGYDFWDNKYSATRDTNNIITADKTNIRLYSAHAKVYQIEVIVEDGSEIASGDNISLFHEWNIHLWRNRVGNYIDFTITDWSNSNDRHTFTWCKIGTFHIY